ncbi:uncharacterized protein LOC132203661 [Neocloeon triangulifer]|uniref:uncharacterized protein LOC132203661 n=1 Tax=Neocloeon triangulifer TaxID=2078957 RepID=UPI00286EC050|nr:uncharacterized protein LOC132203661 [Neocloeon triangulifer]
MELTSAEDIRAVLAGALKGSRDVNLISYRLVSNSPNGFNGLYYTVLIDYSQKNNEQALTLSCFAKGVPPSRHHVAYIKGTKLLHKENEFFQKLLPFFQKHVTFEVPVPKCYFSRFDEDKFVNSLVIMEDLQVQGFITRDRLEFMNERELFLVMPALAKLHAASLIAEEKSGIDLKQFCQFHDEALWTLDEENPAYKWLQSSIDTIIDVAKSSEKFADRIGKNEHKLARAFEEARLLFRPSGKYRNCVCHGDIWNNNLMFKYSGCEATDVRIIDMQVYRLAPPVTDVLMFLFLNCDRQVRAQVMDRLISDYWKALGALFRDAACLLPEEMADLPTFQRLAEEFWLVGLVAAAGYVPMNQMPPGAREKNMPQAAEGEHDFDVVDDFLKSRGAPVLRGMEMSNSFKNSIENVIEELFKYIGI